MKYRSFARTFQVNERTVSKKYEAQVSEIRQMRTVIYDVYIQKALTKDSRVMLGIEHTLESDTYIRIHDDADSDSFIDVCMEHALSQKPSSRSIADFMMSLKSNMHVTTRVTVYRLISCISKKYYELAGYMRVCTEKSTTIRKIVDEVNDNGLLWDFATCVQVVNMTNYQLYESNEITLERLTSKIEQISNDINISSPRDKTTPKKSVYIADECEVIRYTE